MTRKITRWEPRVSKEQIHAPHDTIPLEAAVKRHVENGAVKIRLDKPSGQRHWNLEATRYRKVTD